MIFNLLAPGGQFSCQHSGSSSSKQRLAVLPFMQTSFPPVGQFRASEVNLYELKQLVRAALKYSGSFTFSVTAQTGAIIRVEFKCEPEFGCFLRPV